MQVNDVTPIESATRTRDPNATGSLVALPEGTSRWCVARWNAPLDSAGSHAWLHIVRETDVAEIDGTPLPANGRPVLLALPDESLRGLDVRIAPGMPAPGVELARISRREAAMRLLFGIGSSEGWWGLLSAGVGFALQVARGQIRRGYAELFQRYRQGLRRPFLRPEGDPFVARWLVSPYIAPQSMSVRLLPIKHLEGLVGEDGRGRWLATGDDPQFLLSSDDLAGPLPAGWYVLQGRLPVYAGRLLSPCLYPDYGTGASPADMVLLPAPGSHGRLTALVLLRQPAVSLRFDPTMRCAEFEMADFRLRRVSRPAALIRMLGRVAHRNGRWSPVLAARATRRFLRLGARHGLSYAAGRLFDEYFDACRQGASSYAEWVRLYDTHTEADLAAFRLRAAAIARPPLISVLLPTYETPPDLLRRCIDSVREQAYPHWELCIADDASRSPGVSEVLAAAAAEDPRIRITHRETNGHISEASNTALSMARGDYVALLDHDDELRPNALLEAAEAIQANPRLQLVYSDEDKIDGDGRRMQPYFKPDWNPDLLLSQNYVCHLTVLQAERVRQVGGFRAGFEGSQDHDLLLRATAGLANDQVHHVPRILYHWRAVPGSTALARDAKDYAADAGARAISDHLAGSAPEAQVELLPHGHYRVRWPLPSPAPMVSLIVPTRDRVDLLRVCVESVIQRTRYPDFEIMVVDNQSAQPETLAYLDEIASHPKVRVLRYDLPFNYSAINNFAVAQARGAVVGLVNNDIEVISSDWLDEMVSQALRDGIGAVGAMLYYPDDTIQHAGVMLGIGGVANHAYQREPRGTTGHGGRACVVQSVSAVTGACLVVRRSAFEQIGGLDESFAVAFNDIDFCLRLRQAGYRNLWTPFAELYHHESATRGNEDTEEKRLRFENEARLMQSRWGPLLANDPAYNPNLSLESLCSAPAFPPRV